MEEEFHDTVEEQRFKKDALQFHRATAEGNLDIVRQLYFKYTSDLAQQKKLIEDGDYNENTPLQHAASSNRMDIVRFLLEVAEDMITLVNAKNKRGDTAMHFAAHHGHLEVVKYLVNVGKANANVKDKDGNAPLHFAAEKGHLKLVEFLVLEAKAEINVLDMDGCTPLHKAAYENQLEIVHYLVAVCKADTNVMNEKGETPFLAAKKSNRREVASYLSCSRLRLFSTEAAELFCDILGEKMNETKRYLSGHKPIVKESINSQAAIVRVHDLIEKSSSSSSSSAMQWRFILEALSEAIAGSKSMATSSSTVHIHVLGDGRSGKSVMVRLLLEVLAHGTALIDSIIKKLLQPDPDARAHNRGVEHHSIAVTEGEQTVNYVIHDYESQDGLSIPHANSLCVANSVYCIVVPLVLFEDAADRNRLRSEEEVLDRFSYWTQYLYSIVKKSDSKHLIPTTNISVGSSIYDVKLDSVLSGIPLVTILNRFHQVHVPPEHIERVQVALCDHLKNNYDVYEIPVSKQPGISPGIDRKSRISVSLGARNSDFIVPSKQNGLLDLAARTDILELIQGLKKCLKVAMGAPKSSFSPILSNVLERLPSLSLPLFVTQGSFRGAIRELIDRFDYQIDYNELNAATIQILHDSVIDYVMQSLITMKKIVLLNLPLSSHKYDLITDPVMLSTAIYSDLLYWYSRHGPMQKLLHEQPQALKLQGRALLDRLSDVDKVRKHAAFAMKEQHPPITAIDLLSSLHESIDDFRAADLLNFFDLTVPFSDSNVKDDRNNSSWLLSLNPSLPVLSLEKALIFDGHPDCQVRRYFRVIDFKTMLIPGFFTKLVSWILHMNPSCSIIEGYGNGVKIAGQEVVEGIRFTKQILLYEYKEEAVAISGGDSVADGFIVAFGITGGSLPRHIAFDDLNNFRSLLYSQIDDGHLWGLEFEEFCLDSKLPNHQRLQPLSSVESHVFGIATSIGGDPKSRLDEKVKAKELYFGHVNSQVFDSNSVNSIEEQAMIPFHTNDYNQRQMNNAIDTSLALMIENSVHSIEDLVRQIKNFGSHHDDDSANNEKRWKVYQLLKLFCSLPKFRYLYASNDSDPAHIPPKITLQYFEALMTSITPASSSQYALAKHTSTDSHDTLPQPPPTLDVHAVPMLMAVKSIDFMDQAFLHSPSFTSDMMAIYRSTSNAPLSRHQSNGHHRSGKIYTLHFLCQVCGKVPVGAEEGYRIYKSYYWFQRAVHASYESMRGAVEFALRVGNTSGGVSASGVESINIFGGSEQALNLINDSFSVYQTAMTHDIPFDELAHTKSRLDHNSKGLPRSTLSLNDLPTLTQDQILQSFFVTDTLSVQRMQSVAGHLLLTYPEIACGLVKVTRNHPEDTAWVCCDGDCIDCFQKTGRALIRFKL